MLNNSHDNAEEANIRIFIAQGYHNHKYSVTGADTTSLYTLYNSVFNTLLTAIRIILYTHGEDMSGQGASRMHLDTPLGGVAQVSLKDTDS